MKTRVQAQHLQPGDIVGSGETVFCISAGISIPKGKVEVYLSRNVNGKLEGWDRMSYWGKYTMINVERKDVAVCNI